MINALGSRSKGPGMESRREAQFNFNFSVFNSWMLFQGGRCTSACAVVNQLFNKLFWKIQLLFSSFPTAKLKVDWQSGSAPSPCIEISLALLIGKIWFSYVLSSSIQVVAWIPNVCRPDTILPFEYRVSQLQGSEYWANGWKGVRCQLVQYLNTNQPDHLNIGQMDAFLFSYVLVQYSKWVV